MGSHESKPDRPATKEEGQALADVIGHLSLLDRDGQVRVIRACAAFFGIRVSFQRDSGPCRSPAARYEDPPRRRGRTVGEEIAQVLAVGEEIRTEVERQTREANDALRAVAEGRAPHPFLDPEPDTVLCDGCNTRTPTEEIQSTWCERLAACLLCRACVVNENGRRVHDYPDPTPGGTAKDRRTCRACGNVRKFGDAPEAGCRGRPGPTVASATAGAQRAARASGFDLARPPSPCRVTSGCCLRAGHDDDCEGDLQRVADAHARWARGSFHRWEKIRNGSGGDSGDRRCERCGKKRVMFESPDGHCPATLEDNDAKVSDAEIAAHVADLRAEDRPPPEDSGLMAARETEAQRVETLHAKSPEELDKEIARSLRACQRSTECLRNDGHDGECDLGEAWKKKHATPECVRRDRHDLDQCEVDLQRVADAGARRGDCPPGCSDHATCRDANARAKELRDVLRDSDPLARSPRQG